MGTFHISENVIVAKSKAAQLATSHTVKAMTVREAYERMIDLNRANDGVSKGFKFEFDKDCTSYRITINKALPSGSVRISLVL